MAIAIIGAGMAGLAAAEALAASGAELAIFDKGRGPGGRMATRRAETAAGEAFFDHGAQYFTVRDPGFAARVALWREAGAVALWPAAGPDALVGTPSMSAPVKEMASRFDIRWTTRVTALARDSGGWTIETEGALHGPFDAVILAIPAEQAGPLVVPFDEAAASLAGAIRAAPCWTVMVAFAQTLAVHDVLQEIGAISWAARNSAKPGRSAPECWVLQAGPDWSLAHLEDAAETVRRDLLAVFAAHLPSPMPKVLHAAAHRWRYARYPKGPGSPLWRPGIGLGLCGDWLVGPRVEAAWLSGHRLAEAMLADIGR